ncbi:hypothetical protein KKG71_06150 [Patescibacteria group bacterium]|nr:hypothetical protein [Patescibacteria group bacterium]
MATQQKKDEKKIKPNLSSKPKTAPTPQTDNARVAPQVTKRAIGRKESQQTSVKKRRPLATNPLKPNGSINKGITTTNESLSKNINLPQEESKLGYYATALGIGLGSYILYKIVTANDDDKKLQKSIAKREGLLSKETDAAQKSRLMAELEKLKADQAKLREQLTQKEHERMQQQALGTTERKKIKESLGDVVKDYKKVLKKMNKGKLMTALKSVVGPTLGMFLITYTSSAGARRFAQTHFGVPDLTTLTIYGNKKLGEILRESINKIKAAPTAFEKKRVLKEEMDRVSGILASLKDMKQYSDLIKQDSKNKVELSSFTINKVATLFASSLLKMHEKSNNGKIKIEGTSEEEQKQFYTLGTYLKNNWSLIEDIFADEKARNPKLYETIDVEDISVRTALGLLFIKKLPAPFYKTIGNIYAARARCVGVAPIYLDFKSKHMFWLRKYNGYLGWGMEGHHGRYLDYLEKKQQKTLVKYSKITKEASQKPKVKKIEKQIMAFEDKMIKEQKTMDVDEYKKLNDQLDELKSKHQKALTDAMTTETKKQYEDLQRKINENRKVAAKVATDKAILTAKTAEARLAALDDDIAKAKEKAKNSNNKQSKKELKQRVKALQLERKNAFEFITEQKHSAMRKMNRAINFTTYSDDKIVLADEGNAFRIGMDDKFIKWCRANEGMINKTLSNPNHEFWQKNSRIMGYSTSDFIVHAQNAIKVSKTFPASLVDNFLKGRIIQKMPILGKANKYFMRGAKGLMVYQAAGDIRQGRYWAVAEMGFSMIPIAGDISQIIAAVRKKTWADRKISTNEQYMLAALGVAGLGANLLTFGLGGSIGKALFKGGTVALKAAGVGKKMHRAIGVATYPMIGFAMYETSKHLIDKLHAYDIMKASSRTAYEATSHTMKVLWTLYKLMGDKYNINPTKGFVQKPYKGIERLTQV